MVWQLLGDLLQRQTDLTGNINRICVAFFIHSNFGAFQSVKTADGVTLFVGICYRRYVFQLYRGAVSVGNVHLANFVQVSKLVEGTYQEGLVAIVYAASRSINIFFFQAFDDVIDADIQLAHSALVGQNLNFIFQCTANFHRGDAFNRLQLAFDLLFCINAKPLHGVGLISAILSR